MSDLSLVNQMYKVASPEKEVIDRAEEVHVLGNMEGHVNENIVRLIRLAVPETFVLQVRFMLCRSKFGFPKSSMMSLSWDI